MSTLSTHVLDTALGKPVEGIRVTLESDGAVLGSGVTDADGRVADLQPHEEPLRPGSYRLLYAVGEYFASAGRPSLYTEIVVQIQIGEWADHYHVPLLLSPFGYTTYRGS
jgi:5-hydroxyisourate hydrolase